MIESSGRFYDGLDIVRIGTPLTTANVKAAYRLGIFPWHIDGMPLPWFCPEIRAVLRFSDLKIPRSLAKARRRSGHTVTIDRDFSSVISACAAAVRPDQDITWITDDFIRVYTEGHRQGFVHSVEVWNESGELVGGLYGVDAGGVFAGESMFHREPNASKFALLYLIEHLAERGAEWIDIQMLTPHLAALGAQEIRRDEFLKDLRTAQDKGLKLF